jgi:hypothetical protein
MTEWNFKRFCYLLVPVLTLNTASASRSFDDLDIDDFDTSQVNDGALVFLTRPPERPVHHMHNDIVITASSLEDGWVTLAQCHEHLDNVPAAQIVFHPERIRNLRVTQSEQIGHAWVEGPSVQLEDISAQARLCLSAESRALINDGSGDYLLHNGPFMRNFLDGYYPMRVTLSVTLPDHRSRLVSLTPTTQPGFEWRHQHNRILVETLFEGKLMTEIRFTQPQ